MFINLGNALKWVFCDAKKINLEIFLNARLQKEDEQQPANCPLFNPHEGMVYSKSSILLLCCYYYYY